MLRPLKVKLLIGKPIGDGWMTANMLVQLLVDIAVVYFLGWSALVYLLLSTFFALGLHPMGGRWIQEHYSRAREQDTHSYYGPLNRLCFNMGYHVEHHDFANVPWNNLPKLRRTASEFYDSRFYYRSWLAVVWNFIFDPEMSAYSRIIREADRAEDVQFSPRSDPLRLERAPPIEPPRQRRRRQQRMPALPVRDRNGDAGMLADLPHHVVDAVGEGEGVLDQQQATCAGLADQAPPAPVAPSACFARADRRTDPLQRDRLGQPPIVRSKSDSGRCCSRPIGAFARGVRRA